MVVMVEELIVMVTVGNGLVRIKVKIVMTW